MKVAVALLVALGLFACGSEGPITDQGECEERLTDHLADAYDDGEIPVAGGYDSDEVSEAIEDTLPEFCNAVELREGVEIDEIDGQAQSALGRELRGF